MLPDTAASKVTAAHLSRRALLYQPSLKQVIHNTESAIRQYDLRGKAISLGWDASQVTVTGIDQGHSAASAAGREGFQQMVAEVSLGRAGIVLGLECSRLARNKADWHQLLAAYDKAREQHDGQLTDAQKARIAQLATDLPGIWNDPATPMRERKRIARLLLTDVTVTRTSDTITAPSGQRYNDKGEVLYDPPGPNPPAPYQGRRHDTLRPA